MNHQLWVLDTDTVSLIQRGSEVLRQRLLTTLPEQIAVTAITLFEQLRGRLADVNRAREGTSQLLQAYRRLQETVLHYCNVTVLPFDDVAATKLAELRKQKVRLSTQDLRIAAIVLSMDGILVTCNTRDFRKVPGLSIEDWNRA